MLLFKSSGEAALELCVATTIGLLVLFAAAQGAHRIGARLEASRIASLLETLAFTACYREETLEVTIEENSLKALINQEIVGNYSLPAHLSLKAPRSVKFYPSGAASAATILVNSASQTCAVKLSLFGRLKVIC